MGKFKRSERREVPPLNTSSLPDLIFTLLFFFMITTSMKEMPLMVDIDPPTATELTKLEKKIADYVSIHRETLRKLCSTIRG